ncbi:hypothetical protein ACROYT_G039679 [Oculina patagonica]
MNRILCLSIAAVFLFEAAVVHGQDAGTLQAIDCSSVRAISFEIVIPDIAEWDNTTANADAWALNGKTNESSCKPTFDQGNSKVVYAAFDVQKCGDAPTVSADTTQLEYEFEIDVDAVSSSGSPVTYQYDHHYTVKCYYDREQQNLMASFEPQHELQDSGLDNGTLAITLSLHLSSDDSKITPGPGGDIIDLSTAIYGKAEVEAAGFPFLDVHFQSVTASSDKAGSDEFTLVTDGCEASNGVVDSVECDTNADDTFTMATNGAFRFPGQAAGDQVWFKATVIVCLSSDAASECQKECSACNAGKRRKRRETVQDSLQTKYYVTAGPYRIGNPSKAPEAAVDKDEGAAFPSYVIAIVAVCGVAAIAIVSATVLIVLRRKRPLNATVAEPRDAEATA